MNVRKSNKRIDKKKLMAIFRLFLRKEKQKHERI